MQVFDIEAEIIFIIIKCLYTSCGYELLVTRCRGNKLDVNQTVLVIYSVKGRGCTWVRGAMRGHNLIQRLGMPKYNIVFGTCA